MYYLKKNDALLNQVTKEHRLVQKQKSKSLRQSFIPSGRTFKRKVTYLYLLRKPLQFTGKTLFVSFQPKKPLVRPSLHLLRFISSQFKELWRYTVLVFRQVGWHPYREFRIGFLLSSSCVIIIMLVTVGCLCLCYYL